MGDSVQKVCDLRQLALELLGHALDQEVAQRHPAQPGWQLLME
jgi:hypothetical protein